MKIKTPKSQRLKTNITVDGDSLIVFCDKPRNGAMKTSKGVETFFDPAMAALTERKNRKPRISPGNSTKGFRRVSVNLPAELADSLTALADKSGRSLSEVVRIAVDELLSRHG